MTSFWVAVVSCIGVSTVARAAPLLPYSSRTQDYSGFSTTVRGDIRTIGMAGALIGLGDSFIASGENPAGLAMTFSGIGLQITGNLVHDGNMQDYGQAMTANTIGAAATKYPWGFNAGYWSPQSEGQSVQLASGQTAELLVHAREYRLSAARLFFDHRLSLGASLVLGQSLQSLSFPEQPELSSSDHLHSFGVSLGAMVQLPRRWLIGAFYATPMSFIADTASNPTPLLDSFYRSVRVPERFGVGIGWIPNRFFRFGASVYGIGSTPGVALLSDDRVAVGRSLTFQPRIGGSYTMFEFQELKVQAYLGSYYETSRIDGHASRLHGTAGLQMAPWIFSLGWGIDRSARYKNYIYSAGVDVIRVMQKLELIPRPWTPPLGGVLPRMGRKSDEGLPRPLVKNWSPQGPGTNLLEIAEELPSRVQDRVEKTGEDIVEISDEVKDFGEEVLDMIGDEFEEAARARKRRARKGSGGKKPAATKSASGKPGITDRDKKESPSSQPAEKGQSKKKGSKKDPN